MFDPRKRLMDELHAIMHQNQGLQHHLRNDDGRMPEQREDWIAVLQSDEVVEALDQHTLHRIGQIMAALRRVDAGTYGTSEISGEPIEEGRLQLMPWTTMTAEEAREAEERGGAEDPIVAQASLHKAEALVRGAPPIGQSPGPTGSVDTRRNVPADERGRSEDDEGGFPEDEVVDEEGVSPPGELIG